MKGLNNALGAQMEWCTRLIRTSNPMGLMGSKPTYEPGDRFLAYVRKDSNPETVTAERQAMTEYYTIITHRDVVLNHMDVIRRDRDGSTYRVTGSTRDNRAPDMSSVPISKATAERWEIPT